MRDPVRGRPRSPCSAMNGTSQVPASALLGSSSGVTTSTERVTWREAGAWNNTLPGGSSTLPGGGSSSNGVAQATSSWAAT